jgi:peptidoglycan/xylan/chitin deacetylase (PgdA/CDA1 family)
MITNLTHRAIEKSMAFSNFSFWQKKANVKITIPFYHIVSNSENPLIANLYRYRTENEFISDLEFFQKHYQFIDIKQLLDFQKNGLQLPKNALLLTFDDGMREMYETVAPILTRKGIPAVFFLTIDFLNNEELFFRNKISLLIDYYKKNTHNFSENKVKQIFEKYQVSFYNTIENLKQIKFQEKDLMQEIAELFKLDFKAYLENNKPYLTDNQVFELKKQGFSIGAHSLNHVRFSDISQEEQIAQTLESVRIIRQRFELDYGIFAFPFNDNEIGRDFFTEISKTHEIDLLFSADGFLEDEIPFNYHRFWMENTSKTAKKILLQNIKEKIIRQIKGKNKVERK